jgi:hypothetical protein
MTTLENKTAKRKLGAWQDHNLEEIVDLALRNIAERVVVVGPLVWHPTSDNLRYFMVATAEPERGFRCDQVMVNESEDRARIIACLAKRKALVVHDTCDELYMARLCETLWPGERITKIRREIDV